MIELVDGETTQARTALNLLGSQRHLDPGLGGEHAPCVALDIGAGIGLDLVAWAALLTVADVEHFAFVACEPWHDFVDDVATTLAASCGDRAEIFIRDAFENAPCRTRLADDKRRQLSAPAVNVR